MPAWRTLASSLRSWLPRCVCWLPLCVCWLSLCVVSFLFARVASFFACIGFVFARVGFLFACWNDIAMTVASQLASLISADNIVMTVVSHFFPFQKHIN